MTQEGYGSVTLWNSFPGFSMAFIMDGLHSVGILISMKHLFSIVSSHLSALEPRFFSCSIKHHLYQRICCSILSLLSCTLLC